jgi:thiol-disulfide isomerase/thioredoxin
VLQTCENHSITPHFRRHLHRRDCRSRCQSIHHQPQARGRTPCPRLTDFYRCLRQARLDPKTWEPGKVYLFEFWATWCGPCIAAIPHVNELHKKYAAKGLIVNGINIKEDGKEKVADFVKNKGDGMSYNVAYSGDKSPFLTEWYDAFGLRGIPTTLIVKDGKLILRSHPMRLTDEIIEAILAGGDAQEQAITRMSAGQVIPQKPTP